MVPQKRKRHASLRGVAWLSIFYVLVSSKPDGTFHVRGLPRGRSQPATSLTGFVPYLTLPLDRDAHSGTSFSFRGVPPRGSLILLGKPLVTALACLDLDSGFKLRLPGCLGHVPTSRVAGWNDFLRGLTSPISPTPPGMGSRLFQRFTARRASVGTDPVMNSRRFTDHRVAFGVERFAAPFPFHDRGDSRRTL